MTHKFQPLDLTINRTRKASLRKNNTELVRKGGVHVDHQSHSIRKSEGDIHISVLKPLFRSMAECGRMLV